MLEDPKTCCRACERSPGHNSAHIITVRCLNAQDSYPLHRGMTAHLQAARVRGSARLQADVEGAGAGAPGRRHGPREVVVAQPGRAQRRQARHPARQRPRQRIPAQHQLAQRRQVAQRVRHRVLPPPRAPGSARCAAPGCCTWHCFLTHAHLLAEAEIWGVHQRGCARRRRLRRSKVCSALAQTVQSSAQRASPVLQCAPKRSKRGPQAGARLQAVVVQVQGVQLAQRAQGGAERAHQLPPRRAVQAAHRQRLPAAVAACQVASLIRTSQLSSAQQAQDLLGTDGGKGCRGPWQKAECVAEPKRQSGDLATRPHER